MRDHVMPSPWKQVPLGRLFRKESRSPRAEAGIVTAFRDGQVALRSRRRVDGFTEAIQEIGYQGIEAGDLVIHAMDGFAGAIGVAQDSGKSSPVYSALTARDPSLVCPKFFAYVLRNYALSGLVQSFAQGVRERSTDFRWSTARTVPVPLPSINAQRAIADYLDHETAEIDAFVRDQEDLIQLLNERRDAEIVSLLRRPTDPAQRLKFCLTRNEGGVWGTEPEDTQHSTIVLRSTEQTVDGNWRIKDPARRLLPAEEAISKKLRLNDLVVTKSSGSSLHIGKTTLVTKDVEELQACFGNFMQRLRVSPALNPQFLWMLMNSSDIRRQMDYLSNSTTGLSNLNSEVIGDLEIPRVSLQEQIARVARVNSKLAATNDAVSDALQANRLARERRSALISAAVTGQLEVTQRHRPVVEQLEDEVLERV